MGGPRKARWRPARDGGSIGPMADVPPCLRETNAGIELDVLVQPRASRSKLVGLHDGRLKVQLAAPPVDGEANEALIELVAGMFGSSRRNVRIVRGETGRRKTLSIASVALASASATVAGIGS